MGIIDDALGVDVDSILHTAVEIDVVPVDTEKLDDGHHRQRGMFGHSTTCLRCIQFTDGRIDHLTQ